MNGLLDGLNAQQFAAVVSEAKANLVLAGAGSGKTNVLTKRIAFLTTSKNVSPYNVMALTFTRKAAAEMKERLGQLLSEEMAEKMTIGTFHGVSLSLLERYGSSIGYSKNITVYDDVDQKDVVESVISDLGLRVKANAVIRELQGYSADCDGHEFEEEVRIIIQEYRQRLKRFNAVDFTLILTELLDLLRHHPDVFRELNDRYRYVFVDEYQDVDRTQYYLHEAIKPEHIFVVGDVDQAIYGWRGSDVGIVLDFQKHHPGAEIHTLEQSYRCPKPVLDAANKLIAHNPDRFEKTMWTENAGSEIQVDAFSTNLAEAEFIAATIKNRVEHGLNDAGSFAVIARTHAQLADVAMELDRVGVNYVKAGSQIAYWKQPEVRDIISILKVLHNNRNSWHFRKLVRSVIYGLTDIAWQEFEVRALERGVKVTDLIIATKGGPFMELVKWFDENRTVNASTVVDRILDTVKIRDWYEARGLKTRTLSIDIAGQMMTNWELTHEGDVSVEGFLAWVSSQDVASEIDESDSVKLATIHAVKGLEFDNVIVIGMNQELLPHKRALAAKDVTEERRLAYVAITRARRRLYLTSCVEMIVRELFPRHMEPSQFIEEMGL